VAERAAQDPRDGARIREVGPEARQGHRRDDTSQLARGAMAVRTI
jgi:hypothetical protein